MRDYKIGDVVQRRDNPVEDLILSYIGYNHVKVDSNRRILPRVNVRPKYWYVKRPDDIDNPIWQRISKFIRTNSYWSTREFVDMDQHYKIFGYDGNKSLKGFNCYQTPTAHNFQNNAFELTLEEWDKFDYDGLNGLSKRMFLQNQYKESNVYMETKETVTISRRDLIALNGRSKFTKCDECKEVLHYYLEQAKYSTDDSTWAIEPKHLDMIPRLTAEQRKVLSEYIKLPELSTFQRGDRFNSPHGPYMITRTGNGDEYQLSSLKDGNIYAHPVRVKDCNNITLTEFYAMTGWHSENFEKVTKIT